MDNEYKIQIVAYGKSDLSDSPYPFTLDQSIVPSPAFSGMALAEAKSVADAYSIFECARMWNAQQLRTQEYFGAHVKLKRLRSEHCCANSTRTGCFSHKRDREVIHNTAIAAWEVYLQGKFRSDIKEGLEKAGYVPLDRVDSEGKAVDSVLTMYFLRQETCLWEYDRIYRTLAASGGFSGKFYLMEPLGFAVFQEQNNVPRPIML
jgi:hypothetical protein